MEIVAKVLHLHFIIRQSLSAISVFFLAPPNSYSIQTSMNALFEFTKTKTPNLRDKTKIFDIQSKLLFFLVWYKKSVLLCSFICEYILTLIYYHRFSFMNPYLAFNFIWQILRSKITAQVQVFVVPRACSPFKMMLNS